VLVAIPSKGRAGAVKTLRVLPSSTVFAPVLEVDAYRVAGARHVVGVPDSVRGITATRNWILQNTDDRRIVMIDDDVVSAGYIKLHPHAAQNMTLSEAVWLGEFRKLFDVTEDMGFRLWGLATDGATRAVYPYHPFRFRSYVTASCMGLVNDGRTLFDESYPLKEDYELCLRCIVEDGGVVSAQYLYWRNSHWLDAGGCKDYRTQAIEADCIKRLRRTYPGLVRVAQRANSQWAIEVAA
jgi:hypothetical protein